MKNLLIILCTAALTFGAEFPALAGEAVDLTLTGQVASECNLTSPGSAEQTLGDARSGLRVDGELTARFGIRCNSPIVGEFRLENGVLAHLDPKYEAARGGLSEVPIRVSADTGMPIGNGQFDGAQLTSPQIFSSGDEPVFEQDVVFRIAWDGSDRYYAGRYGDVLHVTLQAVP